MESNHANPVTTCGNAKNYDERLTFHSEVDGLDLDGDSVDLTVVDALVLVPDPADVQVPVLGERPLYGQPLVVYDAAVFIGQQRGELVSPYHLVIHAQHG